jgi:hypothetical protein
MTKNQTNLISLTVLAVTGFLCFGILIYMQYAYNDYTYGCALYDSLDDRVCPFLKEVKFTSSGITPLPKD